MIGLFSPVLNVKAQYAGVCWSGGLIISSTLARPITNQATCTIAAGATLGGGRWWQSAGAPPPPNGPTPIPSGSINVPVNAVPQSISPPTTNYVLLAPLSDELKNEGFNYTDPNALGKYLNTMISIFIGLCAVLAVVMIVLGGIEYTTSELVHSKEAGKEKIKGALLGLLIALGAYALLNTINPDLLNSNVVIPGATVLVTIEGESLSDAVQSDGGPVPTGPTIACATGIVRTASGMLACGTIAQNLDSMINAARLAGHNITGGGYRTPERQRQLRVQNCNGNIDNSNASCRPPTALPGASRHNNGLAFDLKCSGTTIQTRDNACFIWLSRNASRFGLSNLASEPWHWSTDGR